MTSFPPYLIDSSSFMEAKNRYYAFDICPGFWDFLIDDFNKGRATSIVHVYAEIEVGGDELTSWLKQHFKKKSFIDCLSDNDVFAQYITVADYVNSTYKENVAADFLKEASADPWLIAQAIVHGGCIVTQETPKPNLAKASLVDICDYFEVHHLDVIEFLRNECARFEYHSKEQQ